MPRSLWIALTLAAFAACTTAPKSSDTNNDVAQVEPVKDTTTSPTPQPQDIKWEEECLVYPKQNQGLQGSGIRRNCTASEAPESVSTILKEGLAADEQTATALARIFLVRVYGQSVVDSDKPAAIAKGDRWLVQWEVKTPESKQDALKRLSVEIVKKTGAVARMFVSVIKE